jgi:N-acetylmuramoyl-L-alanine amidase
MAKDTGTRKYAVALALTLALCFLLQASVYAAATLKVGSSGADVTTLQTKLKRWGYYSGAIDGKFGAQTKNAVIISSKRTASWRTASSARRRRGRWD